MKNKMSENQESKPEFDIAVDLLIDHCEYFSSKEGTDKLIKLIHRELGIPKLAARGFVKYLAPWVLGRARQAGKKIGSAWMEKLHTNLSGKFKLYRLMTTDVAGLLLAKVNDSHSKLQEIADQKQLVDGRCLTWYRISANDARQQ